MRFEKALAGPSPLQREIVSALLSGEEETADEARRSRFPACDRLRRALDPRGHSEPYLPD